MMKKIIILAFVFFAGLLCFYGRSTVNATESSAGDMRSSSFKFDVSSLSPSTKKYTQGGNNVKALLATITNLLLIILPTISVLFMVSGGIMIIASGGASEKVTKGKNIVIYNIVAIVIALLSYSIIRLVIWILGSTAY
ncbi:MAG: hypothetical protein PHS92_03045 [Candidatus Gracilibacteria bacterium]|nr:hypothetical protein [Candidatus Gracilibacteria bacterium]